MSLRKKKLLILFTPVLIVFILDQVTKQLVRTNPGLHRVNVIDGWLALNFTKNPGMAMGMDFLSTPVISIVAIVATIAIFAYILSTMKDANFAYLLCMGLILGGALGNISDRIFMGIAGGYGGVLDGHVVDFIHFNLTIGETPVFPYIFNVADIAITTAIITMLVFHKRIMPVDNEPKDDEIQSGETGGIDLHQEKTTERTEEITASEPADSAPDSASERQKPEL
ncbi:signal peptidase II [Rhodohalobacter sp. SW132]|uniref:signal peptidase II n=1 Tax=Rhodohalobacter sp. SW132 TaxID=2293433 RepID=UPI000E2504EB|nr:signal peptidase II [Rhodohalobacter sp. SW132]REL38390.1 signal peptidase II [Rhodohalobacter sp. SW132]